MISLLRQRLIPLQLFIYMNPPRLRCKYKKNLIFSPSEASSNQIQIASRETKSSLQKMKWSCRMLCLRIREMLYSHTTSRNNVSFEKSAISRAVPSRTPPLVVDYIVSNSRMLHSHIFEHHLTSHFSHRLLFLIFMFRTFFVFHFIFIVNWYRLDNLPSID